ncbi:hypothetical protein ANN_14239 [Periplaneta americana]|uniref:DUF4817 domain-containing protein n=1 Tax=Periplaneta americana TaxID=6978 RepID=A0ABQ8SXX4_PERAM|nr:hypothetical protein ANN_14239 [Periplaneta americana]
MFFRGFLNPKANVSMMNVVKSTKTDEDRINGCNSDNTGRSGSYEQVLEELSGLFNDARNCRGYIRFARVPEFCPAGVLLHAIKSTDMTLSHIPPYCTVAVEYADIVYVYGLCDGSSLRAVAEYERRFPNRRVPYRRIFTVYGVE